MNSLLIFRRDRDKIQRQRLLDGLRGVKGISDLVAAEDSPALEAEYRTDADATIIRLSSDGETVSVSGTGPASLDLAVTVGRLFPEGRLLITDTNFSFLADLPHTLAAGELHSLIENGVRIPLTDDAV